MCKHEFLCLYVVFVLFLWLLSCVIVSSYIDLLVFYLFYYFIFYYNSLDGCLFSKERQKGMDTDGMGRGEELEQVRGVELKSEYIARKIKEKRIYFQQKKKSMTHKKYKIKCSLCTFL